MVYKLAPAVFGHLFLGLSVSIFSYTSSQACPPVLPWHRSLVPLAEWQHIHNGVHSEVWACGLFLVLFILSACVLLYTWDHFWKVRWKMNKPCRSLPCLWRQKQTVSFQRRSLMWDIFGFIHHVLELELCGPSSAFFQTFTFLSGLMENGYNEN